MKGSERHHLKDNELVNLAVRARRFAEEQQRGLLAAVVVILAVGGGVVGYMWWQGRVETRAEVMMTEAVVIEESPVVAKGETGAPAAGTFATERERIEAALEKYKAVADAYPRSDAGLFARYKEAAMLVALGRSTEALAAYQQVADSASDKPIGQAARLGLAEAHVRASEYDQAIKVYEDAAARTGDSIPVEGVLVQLGRAYLRAGKKAEARETFDRVVKEFASSPLSAEAQRELDLLNESSSL